MSLRETIIQNHIGSDSIVHIVTHHYTRYITILFKFILILLPLYWVFLFIQSIISNPRIAVIVGIVALILYFKIIIDFLNYYLDGIILTNKEIIVFKWEGLLNYKTEHIALDSIEGISYTQNGLYDVFWNIGDISIRLNHGITIPFDSIYKPKDQTQHLMSLKEQYIANSRFDFDNSTDTNDQDKFNILVETLSTMILDHVKKE